MPLIQPRHYPGQTIGETFRVVDVRRGGMGEVYLCEEIASGRPCALKTFQRELRSYARMRRLFERESATWALIDAHPNIVRLHSVEIFSDEPYAVMDWVVSPSGYPASLRNIIRNAGSISVVDATRFGIDVCRAFIHAKSQIPDLVHLDLKPENLLISPLGTALVSDWGLSRRPVLDEEDGGPDADLGPIGTPPYMAPELWNLEELDQRTDIYALGCILFELLTDAPPFCSHSIAEMSQNHRLKPAPILNKRKFHHDMVDLIAACLSKEPSHRPESFSHVFDRLQRIHATLTEDSLSSHTAHSITTVDLHNRAASLWRLGRFEAALEAFDRLIQINDQSGLAYSGKGLVLRELNRLKESLDAHDAALILSPDDLTCINNRANTLAALGRHEEALSEYGRAIELDTSSAVALCNRGHLYIELQKQIIALKDIEAALARDPTFLPALNARAALLVDIGNLDEGVKAFAALIEVAPFRAMSYFNRGNLLRKLGRANEAVADYDMALMIDPNYWKVLPNRSNALVDLGRHKEALADCELAVTVTPNSSVAWSCLGASLLHFDRHLEGHKALLRSLEIDPRNIEANANLALALTGIGQTGAALDQYDKLFRLAPHMNKLRVNRANLLLSMANANDNSGGMLLSALVDLEAAADGGQTEAGERAEMLWGFISGFQIRASDLAHASLNCHTYDEFARLFGRFHQAYLDNILTYFQVLESNNIDNMYISIGRDDLVGIISTRISWLRQLKMATA